ncbi:MAG: DUF3820 family protein [Candidatus Omnitrophica bacterium]|nr:DUF3820 family protein [Candidatus Omnitrophota bacterium]
MVEDPQLPNPEYLLKLLQTRMPFGKYKNHLLMDLPEDYICWFSRKGFPEGSLGVMLKSIYEIKLNGLEGMLEPIRKNLKKMGRV